MNIKKKVVPKMDPWGSPDLINDSFEDPSPLSTICWRLDT